MPCGMQPKPTVCNEQCSKTRNLFEPRNLNEPMNVNFFAEKQKT